jgi:L-alanine-DL-glutamate epimerase-like enolase superfamily enzyme
MTRISDVRFHRIVRPLKTTFSTSLGQKMHTTSVLVTALLENGKTGTGEAPTSLAFRNESPETIVRTIAEARGRLKGLSIDDWAAWIEGFRKERTDVPMTASGLEVALFRACLNEHDVEEHSYWGGAVSRLETDITIPYVFDRNVLTGWIRNAAQKGFTAYKLKVGGEREADGRLLSLVWETLAREAPGFRLRLDGNQCYSVTTFLRFLEDIEKGGFRVELFEQPLKKGDFRGYEEAMKRTPLPIILDESVITLEDAARAIDNNLCDGFNVKIAKSGLSESARILRKALASGKRLMVGCMIETMAGLSAAIFLAAGTGAFEFVDLDSVHFLYGKKTYPGIDVAGPVISISHKS